MTKCVPLRHEVKHKCFLLLDFAMENIYFSVKYPQENLSLCALNGTQFEGCKHEKKEIYDVGFDFQNESIKEKKIATQNRRARSMYVLFPINKNHVFTRCSLLRRLAFHTFDRGGAKCQRIRVLMMDIR